MTVSVSVELPDQPASPGKTVQVPLGGNGFVSPSRRTNVEVCGTGDASGGAVNLKCIFDKRHSAIVNWAYLSCTDPTADTDAILLMEMRDSITYAEQVTLQYQTAIGVNRARYLWRPPPEMVLGGVDPESDFPFFQASFPNINGVDYKLGLELLLFDISAPHRVAYRDLISNQPF